MPDGGTLDRLEVILHDWAQWMRNYQPVRGHASHATVLSSGGVSKSFDEHCEELDAWLCRTCNACIDDLMPVQSAAIYHAYLTAVFRFPRNTLQGALEAARSDLRAALLLRHVVL